jgi:hypothetical protein
MALAAAGELTRAEKLVGVIDDEDLRAQTLAMITGRADRAVPIPIHI